MLADNPVCGADKWFSQVNNRDFGEWGAVGMSGCYFSYELKLLYIFQDKYRKIIRDIRPKEGCGGREKQILDR